MKYATYHIKTLGEDPEEISLATTTYKIDAIYSPEANFLVGIINTNPKKLINYSDSLESSSKMERIIHGERLDGKLISETKLEEKYIQEIKSKIKNNPIQNINEIANPDNSISKLLKIINKNQ